MSDVSILYLFLYVKISFFYVAYQIYIPVYIMKNSSNGCTVRTPDLVFYLFIFLNKKVSFQNTSMALVPQATREILQMILHH